MAHAFRQSGVQNAEHAQRAKEIFHDQFFLDINESMPVLSTNDDMSALTAGIWALPRLAPEGVLWQPSRG
jgi:hypothetical protein